MARFKITFEVDVDLDAWAAEYDTNAATAVVQALQVLRQPEEYRIGRAGGVPWARLGATMSPPAAELLL